MQSDTPESSLVFAQVADAGSGPTRVLVSDYLDDDALCRWVASLDVLLLMVATAHADLYAALLSSARSSTSSTTAASSTPAA